MRGVAEEAAQVQQRIAGHQRDGQADRQRAQPDGKLQPGQVLCAAGVEDEALDESRRQQPAHRLKQRRQGGPGEADPRQEGGQPRPFAGLFWR